MTAVDFFELISKGIKDESDGSGMVADPTEGETQRRELFERPKLDFYYFRERPGSTTRGSGLRGLPNPAGRWWLL
jgi:hypothetical protein